MKDRLEQFRKKQSYKLLFIASLCLFGFHLYQMIETAFNFQPLIRTIFFGITCIAVIFTKDKFIPYLLFVFALALCQTIDFRNYTPFILVYISSEMKRKYKELMYGFYFVDIVIVCIRHEKSAMFLAIHIISCFLLHALLSVFTSNVKKRTVLNLTVEEKHILDEIVFKEKKLKEIEGHKQNTVSKKLKTCRDRNNCKSNEELYLKYKEMNIKIKDTNGNP